MKKLLLALLVCGAAQAQTFDFECETYVEGWTIYQVTLSSLSSTQHPITDIITVTSGEDLYLFNPYVDEGDGTPAVFKWFVDGTPEGPNNQNFLFNKDPGTYKINHEAYDEGNLVKEGFITIKVTN